MLEAESFAFQSSQLSIVGPSGAQKVVLSDPDARQQLLVSLSSEAIGTPRDITREVEYLTQPAGIVAVDQSGYVVPVSDGTAMITVRFLGAEDASIPVVVSSFQSQRPISFPNDVVPQLTRGGCNSGACHGTPSGKKNFRLSLLGFEPKSDYEYLTRELRGRRIVPAAPEMSLLLRKACGDVSHGGGIRIKKNGADYKLIKRWIQEGLPYGPSNDPIVERIEIQPSERVVQQNSSQQLVVTAFFSDGTTRDVTRVAEYKANQPDHCEVGHQGLVKISSRTGTTSVMIRFQEQVGAFMATVPRGKLKTALPKPSNFIDELIFAKLKVLGLPPSEDCDDATFLRRVTLDITGRIPTVPETKAFMASTNADKRSEKIDALLDSPGYAELFAGKWAAILRNKSQGNLEQVSRETYGFHSWILASLSQNKPYDQFVTELLTARGTPRTNPAVSWYRAIIDPKDQMADVSQVFLGVRIQCAQCHHHPYEKWSQDDYYSLLAFFSTVGRKEVRKLPESDIVYHKRILAVAKNPNTNKELRPAPLDGEVIDIPAERDPRIDLAQWISSPQNPFFAKMLVNRYWKHFLGRSFVQPEDDMRVTNPPTHPKLLDQLAGSFIESGYDLKTVCRAICNSRTYQFSSFPNEENKDDEQNFARYYPRRLAAEVMLDAINDVAGAKNRFRSQPVGIRAVALPDNSVNRESFFLRVFGRPQNDTACECERTASANLAQSLHLINSDVMHGILSTSDGRAIQHAQDKDRGDTAKITELYLQGLSRQPSKVELQVALTHLAKKRSRSLADPKTLSADQAEREAYEDIIWVVVNLKEFLFNH